LEIRPEGHNPESDRETYLRKRAHKKPSETQIQEALTHPVFQGALMVERSEADGCVAGAITTTADTVKAALHCIGLAPGMKTLSSFFMMLFPDRVLMYSDCGVLPAPHAAQLADIAIAASDNWSKLTSSPSKTAFLSFSTKGSAEHESIDVIREALAMAQQRRPDLLMDGELQADAALVSAVGKSKCPDSPIAGEANVLIFPNLHAGNIAYKLTQRLAGAIAVGPILQGLAKPMNDLSRGCSAEDILLAGVITALQAHTEP
jgi:phosphate acetyltransferase